MISSQWQELLSVVLSSNCSQMGAIIQSPEKCFQICLFSVLAASPTQSLLLCFVTSCPSVTFRAIIASKCQLSKNGLKGPNCWKEWGTEQLPCKKIIVATNSQRCHHIHSEVDSIAVLFGNMTAKTGEMLNKTKECKYQYQNKRSK